MDKIPKLKNALWSSEGCRITIHVRETIERRNSSIRYPAATTTNCSIKYERERMNGGRVWKSTDDEKLKAAVWKHGVNDWARISSILVRKSAKQCRARWCEYLDPSIKQTKWTKEDDEELLQYVRLMPFHQWKINVSIVGRTPSQCFQQYEKLLNASFIGGESSEPS